MNRMDPISLEDLALLELLKRIADGEELGPVDSQIEERLLGAGLIEEGAEALALTAAGVALCKSLQHRVAADRLVDEARLLSASSDGSTPAG